jgi:spermidine synthase
MAAYATYAWRGWPSAQWINNFDTQIYPDRGYILNRLKGLLAVISETSSMLIVNVFIAGMGIMAIEMTAFRIMAPYFGTTQLVITNIIGMILFAMAIGNWIGGRLGDKYRVPQGPSWILVIAALLTLLILWANRPILTQASKALIGADVVAFALTLIASASLFSIPFVLMGMIAPYSIRALTTNTEHVGRRAGLVTFFGTLGSILGTYLPTFVFIPLWGSNKTLLLFAGLMFVTGLIGLLRVQKKEALAAAAVFLLLIMPNTSNPLPSNGVLHSEESLYNFIRVVQDEYGRNILYLNEGHGQHSIYSPNQHLVGGIWDYFLALPAFMERETEGTLRVLILGSAAGTISNLYSHYWQGELQIDGVEIDPAITRIADKYFGLDRRFLEIHHQDARTYLQGDHERYDIIIVDAYRQPYIPWTLTTREFFQSVADNLKSGGVLGINVATFNESSPFRDSVEATLSSVFKHRLRVTIGNAGVNFDSNLLVASNRPLNTTELNLRFPSVPKHLLTFVEERIRPITPHPQALILVDDLAPVEFMVDLAALGYFK